LVYLYDFGDGWRHEVFLEKTSRIRLIHDSSEGLVLSELPPQHTLEYSRPPYESADHLRYLPSAYRRARGGCAPSLHFPGWSPLIDMNVPVDRPPFVLNAQLPRTPLKTAADLSPSTRSLTVSPMS
jgi:hypothetical protein